MSRPAPVARESAAANAASMSFAATGACGALVRYFGATSREIFGSGAAGTTWFGVAQRPPAIASMWPARGA